MQYKIGDIVSVTDALIQIREITCIIGINRIKKKYIVLRPDNSKLWSGQLLYTVDVDRCNMFDIDKKYIDKYCWGLIECYVQLVRKAKTNCKQCCDSAAYE